MPRRYGVFWAILCSAVFVLNSTVVAQSPAISNVFDMPAGLTSLKFSNVGDPGNAADTAAMNTTSEDILNVGGSPDHSTGYGSVAYNYAIGTYDVTAAQYVQFLNAVAKTGDPYGLYNPLMGGATSGPASSDPHDPIGTTTAWVTISSGGVNYPVVCGITRTGTAGNYSYALSTTANLGSPPIPATNGNFPVNWDNWGDAARFTNWLENGQPVGPEGPGTTETGSYSLNGGCDGRGTLRCDKELRSHLLDSHGKRMVQGSLLQGRQHERWLLDLHDEEQHRSQFDALRHRRQQREL